MVQTKRTNLFVAALLVMVLVMGCTSGPSQQEQKKIKVGFVYNGAAGDYGWSYAHEKGRQYLQSTMGEEVETAYEVATEADIETARAAMTKFAEAGYDIVVSTSAGFLPVASELKAKYPNVVFVHTQDVEAEGIVTIMPKFYEAKYLTGMAAGLMTKTGKIGYVSAAKFPETISWVNGFAKGVKDVNPDAKIYMKWTNAWHDPDVERDTALFFISEYDVDVLAQEQNSPTVPQVAQDNGRYGLGEYADMASFAPESILTSPVLNWGSLYVDIVRQHKAGTLESKLYWTSMSDASGDVKSTDIAPLSSLVPEEVKSQIMAKRDQMISGQFQVFPEVQTYTDLNAMQLESNIVELE